MLQKASSESNVKCTPRGIPPSHLLPTDRVQAERMGTPGQRRAPADRTRRMASGGDARLRHTGRKRVSGRAADRMAGYGLPDMDS